MLVVVFMMEYWTRSMSNNITFIILIKMQYFLCRDCSELPRIDVENEGALFFLKEAAFLSCVWAVYPNITHLMYHCPINIFQAVLDGTWTGKPNTCLGLFIKNFQIE